MNTFIILGAYIIDLIVGDPRSIPHPVVLFGKFIAFLEKILYKEKQNNSYKFWTGVVLVFLVIITVYTLTYFLIKIIVFLPPFLQFLIQAWLLSTTIATKGLNQVATEIKMLLEKGDLIQARKKVGYIVGRDTDNLESREVVRATVETVAENIVDAITSPLFYAFIGGVPLAVTYRAVNTMDSMLGYKNERYLFFGRCAARVDDILNFFPARLTGLLIGLVSFLLPSCSGKKSFQILLRDARKHPSPNSGFTESAVAGALQIRLGGINHYFGQFSFRTYIGDNINPLTPSVIDKTIQIMYATSFLWAIILTILSF